MIWVGLDMPPIRLWGLGFWGWNFVFGLGAFFTVFGTFGSCGDGVLAGVFSDFGEVFGSDVFGHGEGLCDGQECFTQ